MRIIGLDVSSSTIGYCVLDILDKEVVFVDCSFFKPMKKGNIFERLQNVKNNIINILEKYKPELVAIEDISKFMPNKSSAQTIIQLAIFNRTVGMVIFEYLKKQPELFRVISIRSALKTNKEIPKKENIPQLVEKYLGIKFPYIYGKNKKIKPETYDMSDACFVALYYAYKLTNKLEKLKLKNKVSK